MAWRGRGRAGDAGPDNADACAEVAGACASGYEAHRPVRRARADVGDEYRARADVRAPKAHGDAHGRAPRRGAIDADAHQQRRADQNKGRRLAKQRERKGGAYKGSRRRVSASARGPSVPKAQHEEDHTTRLTP